MTYPAVKITAGSPANPDAVTVKSLNTNTKINWLFLDRWLSTENKKGRNKVAICKQDW